MKSIISVARGAAAPALLSVCCAALAVFVAFFSGLFGEAERLGVLTLDTPWLHVLRTAAAFAAGACLCAYFAPAAAGSGVILVKESAEAARRKLSVEHALGFRTFWVKTAACLGCAAGGGALGQEGPVVHISASLFWIVSERLRRRFDWILPEQWIVMGSAAGFAAAFRAPLAAMIFAAEELGDKSLSLCRYRTPWAVSVAFLTVISLFHFGPLFSAGGEAQFSPEMTFLMIGVGSCCGVMAACLRYAERAVRRKMGPDLPLWMRAAGCGALVGLIASFVGPETIGGGVALMQRVLSGEAPPPSALDVLCRFVNTALTLAAGNAGGTLAPALALGGGVGGALAAFAGPAATIPLTVAGMAAFLGALAEIPFTAAVLMAETTGQTQLFIPALLVSLLASRICVALHR